MFQIDCRVKEEDACWSNWFRYSVPTDDATKCAEYLKCVCENAKKMLQSNPLYSQKEFRVVYIPADESR